ncbi:MAG TPA: LacI family DNA-binding transcriptional regulator [Pseudonocardiaceae bacterium]|nr:LacI family DNA-binding transcriptional regulator [Pseudonocardiaceae bacterium]
MTGPGRRPTINDVAALAQVSVGTASKALNGRGQLREETRARVLAAAEQLGFQPNALAKGLLSGRSFTVGLITTDSFGRFTIPIMLGAEDALGAGQISVLLCDGRGDAIREQHYVRTLLARRVDGIIVTARRIDPRPPIGGTARVPVVYAMAQSTDPEDCSLIPDDEQGGRIAVEHLLATGRTRIAHITGPQRFLAARRRAAGAEQALHEAGLDLAGPGVLFGEWSEAWGRHATQVLLRSAADVDAIFCGSDQIARGVADALRERGIAVPEQVALVGFDNWDVVAPTTRPPLTTVDMNLTRLGRSAAEHLLAAIDGEPRHGAHPMPCSLVIRDSSRA